MKTTYKIILGFIFLLFIGCGRADTNITETLVENGPKSPVHHEKEKSPPSIPRI